MSRQPKAITLSSIFFFATCTCRNVDCRACSRSDMRAQISYVLCCIRWCCDSSNNIPSHQSYILNTAHLNHMALQFNLGKLQGWRVNCKKAADSVASATCNCTNTLMLRTILRFWSKLRVVPVHHTSHVTRHTSHVTRHTSHVTRHTSHVTHKILNMTNLLNSSCCFRCQLQPAAAAAYHLRARRPYPCSCISGAKGCGLGLGSS
jgi:hypothetical protein